MPRPSVSILVPWRTDHGQRQRVWDRIRPLWQASGFELCTGTPDHIGPFNAAQAFNRAADMATGDVLVTMGADHWPNIPAVQLAADLTSYAGWMPVYGTVGYLSQADTDAVIAGADPASYTAATTAPNCTGILAIRRECWDLLGGMDERYTGWGYEDTALRRELVRTQGDVPGPATRVIELWHDGAHRDPVASNANRILFEST